MQRRANGTATNLGECVWFGTATYLGECGLGQQHALESVVWDSNIPWRVWFGTATCLGECGLGQQHTLESVVWLTKGWVQIYSDVIDVLCRISSHVEGPLPPFWRYPFSRVANVAARHCHDCASEWVLRAIELFGGEMNV
jgi:hypothetical protein